MFVSNLDRNVRPLARLHVWVSIQTAAKLVYIYSFTTSTSGGSLKKQEGKMGNEKWEMGNEDGDVNITVLQHNVKW